MLRNADQYGIIFAPQGRPRKQFDFQENNDDMPDADATVPTWTCPSCDSRMQLTVTERHRPGLDCRTFYCGPCDRSLFFAVPSPRDR
jgi:hypothetical protein